MLFFCVMEQNFRVISDSLMEGVLMDTIKHVGLRDPTDDKIVFEYMETVFFVDVRILYQSNSLEDQLEPWSWQVEFEPHSCRGVRGVAG
ncbi:hypothetical protein Tco_1455440 [Tanacetum coccineum]